MLKEYAEYLRDNPKGYWFKRKLYGWGWTPVKWQGWVVVLLYILLVLAFALTLDESSSQKKVVFTFILPLLFLTVALIRISYLKGESPRWQWGLKKKNKEEK